MKPSDTVGIAWLDPGVVAGMFAVSMIDLFSARQGRIKNVIRIEAGGLLSRARNDAVRTFMDDTNLDWLLMIDSDQQLSIEGFDTLVATADASKRPVVGGLYFASWTGDDIYPTPMPMAYLLAENGKTYLPLHDYPSNARVAVDVVGTGCMLVHRSVLQAIRDEATPHEGPNFPWFRDMPVNGLWYGEDVYFCRRIRSLGYPITVHTGVQLPHRKSYWLTEDHYKRSRRDRVVVAGGDAGVRGDVDRG